MCQPNRSLRLVLLTSVTLAFMGWAFVPASGQGGPAAPRKLKCEYLSDPLGVDVARPRLSWVLEHGERGQKQTAYEGIVATPPDALAPEKGDPWGSGKTAPGDAT